MENIDDLKHSQMGVLKYKLANANVFVSPGGYHYIDYLDPVGDISPDLDESELSDSEIEYLEKALQSNAERFENQINLVNAHASIKNKKALDFIDRSFKYDEKSCKNKLKVMKSLKKRIKQD